MADLTIKRGDTKPVLVYPVVDAAGVAVNLTGATVKLTMRTLTSATPAVSNAAVTITNPTGGLVTYSWSAADTAVAGAYLVEFPVTFGDGSTQTYPTDGYLDITIEPKLGDVSTATIVSLNEVKRFLRFSDTDRSHDAALLDYITASVPVIENIVGPCVPRLFEEWYDGGSDALILRHQPVVTLVAVSEYRGPVEYPLSLVADPAHGSVYSAMLDPEGRLVRRGPGGSTVSFIPGKDVVHVIYMAGRSTIGANIKLANLELIRDNYQPVFQGQHPAYGGAQDPGEDVLPGRPAFAVSTRVREFLIPDRRHPSVA